MNEDITREATLARDPSAPDGTFGNWRSDSGFACRTVEKRDLGNAPDTSCIPGGGKRYPVRFRWSEKHQRNVYHVDDVPGRSQIEIHAANLAEQLLGCIAPGASVALFAAGTIRPGVPAADAHGVTASGATLEALEADMRDAQGIQQPFWLTIL